jgi:hypothetical protein
MYLTRGGSVQRSLTSGPRGWPTSHHLATILQVGGGPTHSYKYPSRLKLTHTPHIGNSICKALILSVVIQSLWGSTGFLSSSLLKCKSSIGIL